MPLFMDYHHAVDGLTAAAVADAHRRDLEIQADLGVRYLRYWFNESSGAVFCLVEAPSTDAAVKSPSGRPWPHRRRGGPGPGGCLRCGASP